MKVNVESESLAQCCRLSALSLSLKLVGRAGSAPAPRLSQSRMRTITLRAPLKWIPRRESRPHEPVYKTGAFLCRPQGNVKWCSREDSHLEPLASRASVQLLTPREQKSGAVCRCCPGALCLEDRRARCYTNTAAGDFSVQFGSIQAA